MIMKLGLSDYGSFRVERTRTIRDDNYHLPGSRLSLKAKGLLSHALTAAGIGTTPSPAGPPTEAGRCHSGRR